MKIIKFSILFLFVFSFSTFSSIAQMDVGSWSSFQLNYRAGDKVTLTAKPITRHVSDLSKYADTSIDLIVDYKINSAWSANLLYRYFFIPDMRDREFWFYDINHKYSITDKITFANKLRYHRAVNWNRKDPDFVRYLPKLIFKTNKKITPFIGLDMFYRVEDVNVLSGGRYVAGFNTSIIKKLKITLQYWGQVKYDDEYPIAESHFILINFGYDLN